MPITCQIIDSPGSMLAVRIDLNFRQCIRIYEICSKINVIFSTNINETGSPYVSSCVFFCLCGFGAILKRFREF